MSKDITRQRSRLYLPLGFSFLLPLHQFFRLKQGQISIDRLRYLLVIRLFYSISSFPRLTSMKRPKTTIYCG